MSFTLTNLPTAGAVAEQADLRALAQHAHRRARLRRAPRSKNAPSASCRLWIDRVVRPHAVQLRHVAATASAALAPDAASAAARASRARRCWPSECARRARSVPATTRRRCCNSSWLVAGRESISTLRTPSCSMKRSDSSRAPAPIASMPITEPTPNTMPSAVSSVRVFCARRFANACAEIGDHHFADRLHRSAAPRPRLVFCSSGPDSPAPPPGPSFSPSITTWLSLRRTSFTSCGENPSPAFEVDEACAVALEQRLRRHPQDALCCPRRDHESRAHARPQLRRPGRRPRSGTRSDGPTADRVVPPMFTILPLKRLSGQRHHVESPPSCPTPDGRGPARRSAPSPPSSPGPESAPRPSRPRRVAHLNRRLIHPPPEVALLIRHARDVAGRLGVQRHRFDVLPRRLRLHLRLGPRRLLNGDARLGRRDPVVQVLLELPDLVLAPQRPPGCFAAPPSPRRSSFFRASSSRELQVRVRLQQGVARLFLLRLALRVSLGRPAARLPPDPPPPLAA